MGVYFYSTLVIALIFFTALSIQKVGISSKTLKLVGILLCHSVTLLFRVDEIFATVNEWFPINHIAWLILALCAFTSLMLAVSLFEEFDGQFPFRGLLIQSVFYLLFLFFTFGFVAFTPENVGGKIANTHSQRYFMMLYYSFSAYMGIGLAITSQILREKEIDRIKRLRWFYVLLGLVFYAIYNGSRFLFVAMDHFSGMRPELLAFIAKTSLEIACVSALFLFIPVWFYRALDKLTRLYKKSGTLFRLRRLIFALQREKLLELDRKFGSSSIKDLFNLDYQIYTSVIFILDFKYYGKSAFAQYADSHSSRVEMLVTKRVFAVTDDQGFESLVSAYSELI